MKNKPALTATNLYIALIASLVIIVAGVGIGFYLIHNKLSVFATEVNHIVAESEDSSNSLQRLQNTEKSLKDNEKAIKDVKNIVAVAESYKYQNQIINDINKYANRSGVEVTQYTFDNASGGSTSTSAATAPKSTGEETPTAEPTAGSSLKTASVSVAVKNPTSYRSLLKFIKHIENNLTNMQIANISLTGGDSGNEVTTDTFNIEVHIK